MIKIQNNTLSALCGLGQSPWYDNIDRRLIQNGELKNLFDLGVVGVTSNPAIFEKAISGSDIYDQPIRNFIKRGLTPEEIYDELTAEDIGAASQMLMPVYKSTAGIDGYVSIEVLPDYAYDLEKTIEYARYISKKVGRPNILIKIPGTLEGFEAIRALTSEGISINVTLLFSLRHYEAAVSAYINGLRDRVKKGAPVDSVSSVASVFVSRIDTRVDKLLDNSGLKQLKGKAAIANCKMIYQRFQELFSKENFGDLAERGARFQRPLWASTSAKNPDYSDCIYVDALIGAHTINTMPHNTLEAFLDHGCPSLSLDKNIEAAKDALCQLAKAGIDIEKVCQEIQDEGVRSFIDAFNKLIESIKCKSA